jgi:hypothetical protein
LVPISGKYEMQQEWKSALYWTVTGAILGFGFLAIFTVGVLFLIVGLAMLFLAVFKLWLRGAWAVTLGLGGAPAVIFARDIVEAAASSEPSCTRQGSVTIPASAGEGASVACTPPITDAHLVALALFVVVAASGPAWRFFMRGRFS